MRMRKVFKAYLFADQNLRVKFIRYTGSGDFWELHHFEVRPDNLLEKQS